MHPAKPACMNAGFRTERKKKRQGEDQKKRKDEEEGRSRRAPSSAAAQYRQGFIDGQSCRLGFAQPADLACMHICNLANKEGKKGNRRRTEEKKKRRFTMGKQGLIAKQSCWLGQACMHECRLLHRRTRRDNTGREEMKKKMGRETDGETKHRNRAEREKKKTRRRTKYQHL